MSFHRSPRAHSASGCAALFFLMIALLTIPTTNAALRDASGSGSSIYSAWDAQDLCSAPLQAAGCRIGVTCDACLKRPGCAIESTTGKCVSTSRINASVGIEYFESGKESYCDASDDACTACGASSTSDQAVCRGANGCICVRQCEATPVEVIECNQASNDKLMLFGLIACAIFATIAMFLRVQRRLTSRFASDISRFVVRERREARRNANPLNLKLDGWRHHMENEPKDQPTKIELKRCSRVLSDAGSTDEYRKTEDSDAVSIDITDGPLPRDSDVHGALAGDEYTTISTPRGATSQGGSDRV